MVNNTTKADQALSGLPASARTPLRKALMARESSGEFCINHSLAARILQDVAVSTGVDSEFSIHRSSVNAWRTNNA